MGEVLGKKDDDEAVDPDLLPDTASPCESALSTLHRSGWGRLLPINCTLNAKELIEDTYTIGREPKCAVSITKYDVKPELYKQISKIQCRISRSKVNDDEYVVFLEDLSSNGTYINSKKVGYREKMVISSDDEISFAIADFKVFLFIDSKDGLQWMPHTLASKYHVIKHLGTGGFAEVKLVLDKKSCTKLAVKKLSKAGIEDYKILNEIRILHGLRHPCIVEMIDLEQTDEHAFLIMEYVPNGNLLEKLQKEKKLSELVAKLIFVQLAWAVKYMHEQGIAHRDIKPENILITAKKGGLVVAKIADFGLAKVKDSMTQLKTACGTLNYTAPEILLCKGEREYTNKVDMWGLGAVLYVCLSGRRPFMTKPDEPAVLINKILRGQYSLSSPEWKSVSAPAKALVKNLLTVNPIMRYDSTQALQSPWLKDPVVMKDFCTLFGCMSPFDEETFEPPQKMRRFEPGDDPKRSIAAAN